MACPTWEGLAAEVRSTSIEDFKRSWRRFLVPIQNIEKGKDMPGMVKLFSEMAERGEWDDLRECLAISFETMPSLRVANPKP